MRVLAVILLVVFTLAGCSRGEAPTTAPLDAPVVQSDPDEVARWVLTEWFGWRPGEDANRDAASLRAGPLLADEYRQVLEPGSSAAPSGEWVAWGNVGAVADVAVVASPEPLPPASDTATYRAYRVDVAMRTPDGRTVVEYATTVHVVLSRAGSAWRVAHIQLL